MAADDTQTAPVDAGTGVGAIVEVKTAAQVVSALSDRVEPA